MDTVKPEEIMDQLWDMTIRDPSKRKQVLELSRQHLQARASRESEQTDNVLLTRISRLLGVMADELPKG